MSGDASLFDTFITVAVPLRNAAGYVEEAVREIDQVVRASFRHYEILLVDDASADDTVAIVQRLQRTVENIQLYCLNRRGGLDVALIAGLDHSIGDYVITLNVQTDPASLIPVLWQKAQAGHVVVCGVRSDVPAHGFYALVNRCFYRVFEALTGLRVPAGISDLRLYSRQAVGYITQNNDRHLLLRVLPFLATHRVGTLDYQPVRRGEGFGRRGPSSAFLSGITILLSCSSLPLRLLTLLSVVASSLSLAYAVYVVAIAVLQSHVVEGWVSIALPMAVMFFFLSTILGILSEYTFMLAQQSGNRPVYSIVQESTSSVLEIQQKLNVVAADGDFANLISSTAASPSATGQSETAGHRQPGLESTRA